MAGTFLMNAKLLKRPARVGVSAIRYDNSHRRLLAENSEQLPTRIGRRGCDILQARQLRTDKQVIKEYFSSIDSNRPFFL